MHGERIVMYTEVEMYTRSQCFKPMLSQLKTIVKLKKYVIDQMVKMLLEKSIGEVIIGVCMCACAHGPVGILFGYL